MSKTKAKLKTGPLSTDRVKTLVERVEKLVEEREAVNDDIRDVFAEAKGIGYDVKTLRWLIQERKLDAADRDERDALRDTYAHALGMAVELVRVEGLSQREAAKRAGVSKSSVNRALAVPAMSQEPVPHDPGTGEITEPRSPALCASDSPEPVVPTGNEGRAGERGPEQDAASPSGLLGNESVPQAVTQGEEGAATISVGAVAKPEAERVASPESDDRLDFPPFLTKAGQRARA